MSGLQRLDFWGGGGDGVERVLKLALGCSLGEMCTRLCRCRQARLA